MVKSFVNHVLPALMLVVSFIVILPVKGQTGNQTTTQQIVDKIESTIKNGNPAEIDQLVNDLQKQGAQATEVIQASLTAQNRFQAILVGVLISMAGDASTKILLDLVLQDPNGNLGALCMQGLENRPVNHPLTERQLQILMGRVQNADVIQAGMVARLLARCNSNDAVIRARPIIARFKKEIANPGAARPPAGSYLSAQTYALNQFLLAFSSLKDARVGNLLAQEIAAPGEANTLKWLTIAKGFTGDDSVAANLQTIAQQDKDLSIRAVALRAYARAAKEKAIPFLMTFVDDKNVAGEDSHGKLYPLQIVSQGEITMLKNKIAGTTP